MEGPDQPLPFGPTIRQERLTYKQGNILSTAATLEAQVRGEQRGPDSLCLRSWREGRLGPFLQEMSLELVLRDKWEVAVQGAEVTFQC